MIEEDYVSFETAKLLKEKGFDEPCFALYNPEGELILCGIRLSNTQVERVPGSYSAPTHQMAMKLLREVHNIHIKINLDSFDGINPIYEALYDDVTNIRIDNFIDYGDTYEEACETAIKFCLEHLI